MQVKSTGTSKISRYYQVQSHFLMEYSILESYVTFKLYGTDRFWRRDRAWKVKMEANLGLFSYIKNDDL